MENEVERAVLGKGFGAETVRAFGLVVEAWGLSDAEAAALSGSSLANGAFASTCRHSDFVEDRMALAVRVHAMLAATVARSDIRSWLRRRMPGALACPLHDMSGSSDRLRGILKTLVLEASR